MVHEDVWPIKSTHDINSIGFLIVQCGFTVLWWDYAEPKPLLSSSNVYFAET